jgi:hypothetical protein
MGNLIIFRDINLPDSGEAIDPLVLQREEQCLFHWIFGTDEAEFQSLAGQGEALDIVKIGADPDPVVSANYVTVKYSPSLDTNWHKANAFTVCIAAKYDGGAQGNVYFGNKVQESIILEHGFHILSNTAGGTLQLYSGEKSGVTQDFNLAYGFVGGAAFDGWFFIGVSIAADELKMYGPQFTTPTDTETVAITIGDYIPSYIIGGFARGATFGQNTADIAEVIIFDSALTIAEMQDVYARSVIRLGDRGITFE